MNPTQEDLDHGEKLQRESIEQDRLRHRTDTQVQFWNTAVSLIDAGQIRSLVDLASRFTASYGRTKGKYFTATWARDLIRAMVRRGVFTEEQLKQLIPDHTIPKRARNKQSKAGVARRENKHHE